MTHKKNKKAFLARNVWFILFAFLFVFALLMVVRCYVKRWNDDKKLKSQQETLAEIKSDYGYRFKCWYRRQGTCL